VPEVRSGSSHSPEPTEGCVGRWRYLDSEWDLPNGEVVVLEIDGGHHLEVAHWEADMKRERAVVITRRWVLRATVFEIRLEAASVFSDLRAMGVTTRR
jgi:hypothetical protein